MSVQVLRLGLPVLTMTISVERPRRRKNLSPVDAPVKGKLDRFVGRSHPVAGAEPSLIKLQI